MKLRALWQRITTSRYTRALETEVTLLRAENRALLNSILGIAGVPPIPVPGVSAVQSDHRSSRNGSVSLTASAASSRSTQEPTGSAIASTEAAPAIAVPMRRRSWQQIYRMLEFESARKKREA